MSIDAVKAALAYASAAAAGAASPRGPEAAPRADFGAMLKTAAAEAAQSVRAGETAMLDAAAGRAGLVDVTTAVAAAEVTLETAIAVRNRVVEAYQEIMRMPI